jgi:hypothetical protein
MTSDPTERLCVNTIRAVSADQPQAASSGHPGAPMGCAPMAHLLWGEVMKYSGKDSAWIDRDRFVLSNGHACALQYTMLHLAGYQVSKDDLTQFRKIGSKTPGHPESFMTDGTYPYPCSYAYAYDSTMACHVAMTTILYIHTYVLYCRCSSCRCRCRCRLLTYCIILRFLILLLLLHIIYRRRSLHGSIGTGHFQRGRSRHVRTSLGRHL